MENELNGFYQLFYGDDSECENLSDHFNLEKFKSTLEVQDESVFLLAAEETDFYHSNLKKSINRLFTHPLLFENNFYFEAEIYETEIF